MNPKPDRVDHSHGAVGESVLSPAPDLEPLRKVRFIVVSTALEPDALTHAIGMAPDESGTWTRREPHQHSWQINQFGSVSHDVSLMIGRIFERIEPVRSALLDLSKWPQTTCKLRIVMYITDDERAPVGPGFAIEPNQLRFLADLSASIDADLYGIGSNTAYRYRSL